jgi:hypothetical protein
MDENQVLTERLSYILEIYKKQEEKDLMCDFICSSCDGCD